VFKTQHKTVTTLSPFTKTHQHSDVNSKEQNLL